ncbi:MAG: acylneuraminate cytidylyltransferase, partial [Candidatus Saganbacteria bacterium]|nr:acylneuraminate cytidylyltransferase [Candidatus Saganbacteria bacterium]
IIDPEVIDNVIQYYFDHQNQYDFVSNSLNGSYPRGMDVEVFTFKVLSEAVIEAVKQSEREHVTPFIYNQPQRYKLANIPYFEDQSSHRWTVDTVEDFDLIKKIIETLYPKNPNFGIEEVLGIMKEHPEYMNINKNIKQKMIS